jgi:hypothetical protein
MNENKSFISKNSNRNLQFPDRLFLTLVRLFLLSCGFLGAQHLGPANLKTATKEKGNFLQFFFHQ